MFPIMTDPPESPLNLSMALESILQLPNWNKTYSTLSYEEKLVIYRHPILYGTAIYAILLIIVGTVGNEILEKKLKTSF